jgi:hypothetical protein
MNIKPVPTTASKAEELDTLRKISEVFAAGTYLHDFFTLRLFSWIETQLKNDFAPDVFMLVDGARDAEMKANAEAHRAESALAAAQQDHRRQIEILETALRERSKEIERWTNDSGYKAEQIARLCDEATELYHQARDANAARAEAEAEHEQAAQEILRLKAQMFDMMTSKPAA